MANTLNKIHYAVRITTSSTKQDASIGLYAGEFRFISDGYIPNQDVENLDYYEDGGVVQGTWNTDLLSTNGIDGVSSSINIVAGGDYAFVQGVGVTLVNQTNLGNTIHKSIEYLYDVSPIGSDMQVYVIIDKIWYKRWSGIVGSTAFSENTYKFMGVDKLSNNTNIINNTILGMVKADVNYKPKGDLLNIENLVAYHVNYDFRWDGLTYADRMEHQYEAYDVFYRMYADGTSTLAPMYADGEEKSFNGLGLNHKNAVYGKYVSPSVCFSLSDNGYANFTAPVAGDVLEFSFDKSLYTIKYVEYLYLVDTDRPPHMFNIKLDRMHDDVISHTFLFTGGVDPYNNGDEPIADNLNTLAPVAGNTKLYFTLYRTASETGIPTTALDGGKIIVYDENNVRYEFDAALNSNGGVVITQSVAYNMIKPIRIQHFRNNEDMFEVVKNRDWNSFEIALETASEITLPNDMNPNTPFVRQGDETSSESVYLYYLLTFNRNEIGDRDDTQLGVMLKGIFDNNGQAWGRHASGGLWHAYERGDFYIDNQYPWTYKSDYKFNNATELAATQSMFFEVKAYSIVNSLDFGRIPVTIDSSIVLPNVVYNNDSVVVDLDAGTSFGPEGLSFLASSRVTTNVPVKESSVIKTSDNVLINSLNNDNYFISGQMSGIDGGVPYVIPKESLLSETTQLLVAVRATNLDYDQTIAHKFDNNVSVTTADMTDQQRILFDLNGFCLFSTMAVNEAEVALKVQTKENDVTATYTQLLKDVTLNNGDYSAIGTERDSWLAGVYIIEDQQRYGVVTNLCKQGFVAGFTNRKGVDTYKLVPSSGENFVSVDNSITIDNSISNFTSTPVAMVYNEFTLTGDFDTVSIAKVNEAFPEPSDSTWKTEFVTGIPNYLDAKALWERARSAFEVTGAIHKLPSDRSALQFAASVSEPEYFGGPELQGFVFSIIEPISAGIYVVFNSYALDFDETINQGDILYLSDGIDYVRVKAVEYVQPSDAFVGLVMESSLTGITNFDYFLEFSYVEGITRRRSIYMEKYLDLLLDWTTYPKYQVNFDLPITQTTITYDLMQEVRFSDPIITPELGEYGEGWITALSVDAKSSKISCQVTFTPKFFVIPNRYECSSIIEDQYNVDYIIEDATNTDVIEDYPCFQ